MNGCVATTCRYASVRLCDSTRLHAVGRGFRIPRGEAEPRSISTALQLGEPGVFALPDGRACIHIAIYSYRTNAGDIQHPCINRSLHPRTAADKLRSRRLQRKIISSDNGFVFLYSGFRILILIAPFPRRFKWYNPCDAFIGAFFHLRGKKQHNRKEAGVRLEP